MKRLLYALGIAVAITLLLIFSGMDWAWAKMSEQFQLLQYMAIPGVLVGLVVPVFLPLYYFVKRSGSALNVARMQVSFKATALAMSVALLPLFKAKTQKITALVYAAYIGISVSLTVHWLSDAVAGAIIGYAVGRNSATSQ